MGERVVGRPAWDLSSATRPSSKNLPSSSERSAWGSKAASPREVSSEVMKSRGSEKERDRGRETSRSRKRRRRSNRSPSPRASRRERETPILGKTSGMAAVGAWAARYEVANLLTARCNPSDLVRAIHKGEEGDDEILYRGYLLSPSPSQSRGTRSDRGRVRGENPPSGTETAKGLLNESEDDDKSQPPGEVQLKVPEAQQPDNPAAPPWARGDAEKSKGFLSQPKVEAGDPGLKFAKPAMPPKRGRRVDPKDVPIGAPPGDLGDQDGEGFAKKALPPRSKSEVREPGRLTVRTVEAAKPKTVRERESKDLQTYHEKSLKIFGSLRLMGVDMDLLELVLTPEGKVNEDRFSLHTAPNRASTGLRYARLMENLLRCRMGVEQIPPRPSYWPLTTMGRRLASSPKKGILVGPRGCR